MLHYYFYLHWWCLVVWKS